MRRLLALLLIGLFCSATSAPGDPPAPLRPFPFHRVIVSVDPAARTFIMGKHVTHQVHVLPETKIAKGDGTPAAFEVIVPGQEVRGSVRKRADGDYDAVSLKIGPKP